MHIIIKFSTFNLPIPFLKIPVEKAVKIFTKFIFQILINITMRFNIFHQLPPNSNSRLKRRFKIVQIARRIIRHVIFKIIAFNLTRRFCYNRKTKLVTICFSNRFRTSKPSLELRNMIKPIISSSVKYRICKNFHGHDEKHTQK